MADWQDIRLEYITGDMSYRALGEKYGISRHSVAKRGVREDWLGQRKRHQLEVSREVLRRDTQERISRNQRLQSVADSLIDSLERALQELDIQELRQVEKEKTIDYGNPERPDKPTRELIRERESVTRQRGTVDRAGLKQLSAVMRELQLSQLPGADAAPQIRVILEGGAEELAM